MGETETAGSRHPMSQRFHDLLKEIGELHDRKQADYGRVDDPFANVNGSAEWGIKPWVGALVRATDKVKRLQKYAREGNLANEGARDSFLDGAVYFLIGAVLWEKEAQEKIAAVEVEIDRPWKGTSGCAGSPGDETTIKDVRQWRGVHNHGIDPSCEETVRNGKLVGDCLRGVRCTCAMANDDPNYGHSFDCDIRLEAARAMRK